MKQLTKKYRVVFDQNGIRVDMKDVDMRGTITRTNDNLSTIDSDDYNEVSGELQNNGIEVKYDELPEQGKWVEGEKVYKYNGELIKCKQGHNRTIYEPSQTPALFNLVPGGGDNTWKPNVHYERGFVEYNGDTYRCIQPHTSQEGWEPDNTSSLWVEIKKNGDYPTWQQPTGAVDAYDIGEIVTLNGVLYKSRINANTTNPEQYNDTDSAWDYWDKEPFD